MTMYGLREVHSQIVGVHYPFKFVLPQEASKSMLQTNAQAVELIHWCREHFGPADFLESRPRVGVCRWRADMMSFEFAREDDAFAFKMRWC